MRHKRKKWWEYFDGTVCGAIGVILLFFLQFFWWLAPPSTKVSIWVVYLLVVISFLLCSAIYGIMKGCSYNRLPFNSIGVLQYSTYGSQVILIADPHVELIHGMVVMIYYRGSQDDAETLLAYGFVQTLSSSGYFQVEVVDFLVSGVTINDFESRRIHPHDLLIKPYITKAILG